MLPGYSPHDWIVPQWPVAERVRALCTTRNGGVSRPPYDSLNLGMATQDAPHAVATNWARVQSALDAQGGPVRAVRMLQVHGTRVLPLERGSAPGQQADAATTTEAGVACVAMAADCLPVLLADRAGTRVAAAHAGWRGLAGGVLEATLECFMAPALTGQARAAIESGADGEAAVVAWIGPGIGPAAFEVGAEVRAAFTAHDAAAAQHFTARPGTDKYWADLPALARQRLQAWGVRSIHGNDSSPPWCTVANASRFFSHRRDSATLGATGRMAAFVWLAP